MRQAADERANVVDAKFAELMAGTAEAQRQIGEQFAEFRAAAVERNTGSCKQRASEAEQTLDCHVLDADRSAKACSFI